MSDEKKNAQPASPHQAIGISNGEGSPGESRASDVQAKPTAESPASAAPKVPPHDAPVEKPAKAKSDAKKK